jgi:hypothetical protein
MTMWVEPEEDEAWSNPAVKGLNVGLNRGDVGPCMPVHARLDDCFVIAAVDVEHEVLEACNGEASLITIGAPVLCTNVEVRVLGPYPGQDLLRCGYFTLKEVVQGVHHAVVISSLVVKQTRGSVWDCGPYQIFLPIASAACAEEHHAARGLGRG